MGISLALIVKNGGERFDVCLKSVRDLCDELIVVDTGSTDQSFDIARKYDSRCFSFPWNQDFSAARNHALSKASCDWILILDADEWIEPSSFPWFKKVQNHPDGEAYSLKTYNYFLEKPTIPGKIYTSPSSTPLLSTPLSFPLKAHHYLISEKVRFFKKKSNIRFSYPVHETLEPSLEKAALSIQPSPVIIHHSGYLLEETRLKKKAEAYFKILSAQIEGTPQTKKDKKVFFDYAFQCFLLKQHEKSVEYFLKAHAEGLRLDLLDHSLTESFFYTKQYARALDFAKHISSSHSFYGEIQLTLSRCYENMGRKKEAIALLRSAIRLLASKQLYARLGELFESIGNLEAAKQCFKKAHKGTHET